MIVEDNAGMRATIKSLLICDDTEFIEASDGSEGVEIYKRVKPDWVIMDIKMQNMNGIEASKHIKMLDPEANIAIITNYDTKYYRMAALEAGAKCFLSKINLAELKSYINIRE